MSKALDGLERRVDVHRDSLFPLPPLRDLPSPDSRSARARTSTTVSAVAELEGTGGVWSQVLLDVPIAPFSDSQERKRKRAWTSSKRLGQIPSGCYQQPSAKARVMEGPVAGIFHPFSLLIIPIDVKRKKKKLETHRCRRGSDRKHPPGSGLDETIRRAARARCSVRQDNAVATGQVRLRQPVGGGTAGVKGGVRTRNWEFHLSREHTKREPRRSAKPPIPSGLQGASRTGQHLGRGSWK